MTNPFSKSYQPTFDAAEIKRSAQRSRIATHNVERLGLKANPNESRSFAERAAGKKAGSAAT